MNGEEGRRDGRGIEKGSGRDRGNGGKGSSLICFKRVNDDLIRPHFLVYKHH